jgi:RNA polymerase sigma-70 factor (sigma-E family)
MGVDQLQNGAIAVASIRRGVSEQRLDAREALSLLHAQHYTRLVRLAVALVDTEHSAEEVVQDAFLNVMRRWHSIEDVDAAAGYLHRAVVNAARDRLRRRKVRRAFHLPDAVPEDGPEEAALLREEHREVLAVLRTLPSRQRECLILRHLAGLSEAETAAALDITVAAAKSATHKGITALRLALSPGDTA